MKTLLEKLLTTEFISTCDAMYALEAFLEEVDKHFSSDCRGNYQDLYVVGNRVYRYFSSI